jgi:glycosyltransferase involved in cell wall biosynthesis
MEVCVVIPAYDNARTLDAVVRGAREHGTRVIVVDDGSRDETAEILARVEGIEVARHERNRGKGAALRTGFARALAAGCSHAVTVDADGQHPPGEIARFIAAARAEPLALILGERDLAAAGAGFGSRLGRRNSNFWTWVETGLRLPDTQSGYRCYPLAEVDRLRLKTRGYDFEIEVLVKAAWTGVPIRSIPCRVVYLPVGERVSHMRPVLDFFRIALLNTRLVFLRICLPAPFLHILALRRFHELPWRSRLREALAEIFVREPGSSGRIALSAGLGFFMGLAPIWGFQIAATLLASHITGLSKSVAVVAAHISFPFLVPAIIYGSLLLGRFVLGQRGGEITTLDIAPADLPAWILGSLILATLVAVFGGALTYVVVAGVRRLRAAG